MAVYGLCNPTLQGQNVLGIFKGKGIHEKNICPLQNINMLLDRLRKGDTVWVTSIKAFPTLKYYTDLALYLGKNGVSLRLVDEHYLDIDVTRGKCWAHQKRDLLDVLLRHEQTAYEHIVKQLHLNDSERHLVESVLHVYSVSLTSKIFDNSGILKR